MLRSWPTPGALLPHSWCAPGSLLVRSWPTPGTLLVHSWCALDPLPVCSWPTPGACLAHSWHAPGPPWSSRGPLLVRSWLGWHNAPQLYGYYTETIRKLYGEFSRVFLKATSAEASSWRARLGPLLVRSWPSPGALPAHPWRAPGPLLVRPWPSPGALLAPTREPQGPPRTPLGTYKDLQGPP